MSFAIFNRFLSATNISQIVLSFSRHSIFTTDDFPSAFFKILPSLVLRTPVFKAIIVSSIALSKSSILPSWYILSWNAGRSKHCTKNFISSLSSCCSSAVASSKSRTAICSEISFHFFNLAIVYLFTSESINFEHDWHNHIPFSADALSWDVMFSSYLGPPLEAAVIWDAIPIFMIFSFPVPAPRVAFLQLGLLHFHPTLLANKSFVLCEKSSLI